MQVDLLTCRTVFVKNATSSYFVVTSLAARPSLFEYESPSHSLQTNITTHTLHMRKSTISININVQ